MNFLTRESVAAGPHIRSGKVGVALQTTVETLNEKYSTEISER